MKVTPLNDWILVRLDPIKKKHGEIFLTHGDRVRTGTVLAVGPGRADENDVIQPIDIQVEERVAFFREHLEHKQGKTLVTTLSSIGEDVGLLRAADVLFVLPHGSTVEVSE